MRLLSRGSQHVDVGRLQKNLNIGHNENLKIDNIFGPLTETAVRSFQKRANIGVDGVYGPITESKLFDAVKLKGQNPLTYPSLTSQATTPVYTAPASPPPAPTPLSPPPPAPAISQPIFSAMPNLMDKPKEKDNTQMLIFAGIGLGLFFMLSGKKGKRR